MLAGLRVSRLTDMDTNKQVEIRLNELARRAAYGGAPAFSRFLEPSAFAAARTAAYEAGVECVLQGGYPDAERCMAGYGYAGEEMTFPLVCIRAEWNAKYASCGHRDLLGALMGLGVVREAYGDILVDEECAYLFVTAEIAPFVLANLESAGRAKLKLTAVDIADIRLPEPKGRAVRITAASDRIDCVIAEAYNLSRADVKKRIQSGDVKRNHIEELRPDVPVAEGDILSVRGSGRVKVLAVDGQTRKGRLSMQVFVYGK